VKVRRPKSVTLLVLGVLSIAGTSLVRFAASIEQWQYLSALPGVHPLYLTLSGLIWLLVWLPLSVGLWFGKSWAPFATGAASLAYTIYWWADRIIAANVSLGFYSGSPWHFRIIATVFLLGFVYWILTNAKAKAFFRRDA
jgi:hypothetical protein